MKIYLCDLVHLLPGAYTVPLNVAYVASYTKFVFPDAEVEIFKDPNDFLLALERGEPAVVGFSNYSWNHNLTMSMANHVREKFKKTAIVMGGPGVRDEDQKYLKEFLLKRTAVDGYILLEGEKGFTNFVKELINLGSMDEIRKQKPKIGGFTYLDDTKNLVYVGYDRVEDLSMIPSPYLTGILDKFLTSKFIPLFETNRGCPYSCTFCVWGKAQFRKIRQFPLDRVYKEFEYVVEHSVGTSLWILADANFGIFPRDEEIATKLGEIKQKSETLSTISVWTAKNQDERNWKIFKKLAGMGARYDIALQSNDPKVLKEVKRSNISLGNMKDKVNQAREFGVSTMTDILCGLPGENKQSQIDTIGAAFDAGFDFIFPKFLRMLPGSEMEDDKSRAEYQIKTKYRLIDSSYGSYGGIKSMDVEEVIIQTKDMKEEDMHYFRMMHWLVWSCWNCGFLLPVLKYLHTSGVNPVRLLQNIIEADKTQFKNISQLFDSFLQDTGSELFDSEEALLEHYLKEENFNLLMNDGFSKMNPKYTAQLIFSSEVFDEFINLAQFAAKGLLPSNNALDTLFEVCRKLRVNVENIMNDVDEKQTLILPVEVLPFVKYSNEENQSIPDKGEIELEFFCTDEKTRTIKSLCNKFDYSVDQKNAVEKAQEWRSEIFGHDIRIYNGIHKDNKLEPLENVDATEKLQMSWV